MKIILPMSGFGKRFVAAGYTDPKPLLEVDGQPMIKHVIDLFPGETDIHCICNREHIETTDMRSILSWVNERWGVAHTPIRPHLLLALTNISSTSNYSARRAVAVGISKSTIIA